MLMEKFCELLGRGRFGTMAEIHWMAKEDSFTYALTKRQVEVLTTEEELLDWRKAVAKSKACALEGNNELSLRKIDRSTRNKRWSEHYRIKQGTVMLFSHPFAMTIHKSQGSTFKDVYVNWGDCQRAGSRGLYVACSRPSDRLILG